MIIKDRWDGIKRPYAAEEVERLRGSIKIEYTLAKLGAEKLWKQLNEENYIPALGCINGQQAVAAVKAASNSEKNKPFSIYISGWQCAAEGNLYNQTFPDLGLYPASSVPNIVERINNALLRADEIDRIEGKTNVDYFPSKIADLETGFGSPLNVFELQKAMIRSGVSGTHLEDQSMIHVRKCGHLGGKVIVSTNFFKKMLNATRLAGDILDVSTIIIARTDTLNATYISDDSDEYDHKFIDFSKGRTKDGLYYLKNGVDLCIHRGLAYAPHSDLLWMETSQPNIEEAKKFAEGIHKVYPNKYLAYNCLARNTQFITSEGVKSFIDYRNGDKVIVLTHRGNWKHAIVKSHGVKSVNDIYFQRGGKGHRLIKVRATPDHQWLLANGTKTTELKVGDIVLSAPYMGASDIDYETFSFEEKLYWCYGYAYGDGTKIKKNGSYVGTLVRLCKKDINYAPRFDELCFKTTAPHSIQGDYFAYLGTYLKSLPDIAKDPINLIKAFIIGWLDADGTKVVNNNGIRYKYIQATGEESISFLRKSLSLCGFYITSETDLTNQITNYGPRTALTIKFTLSTNKPKHYRDWRVVNIEFVGPEETWCLEVEDDHSFVIPCGIVTGNCSPSFNWKKFLSDKQIEDFQKELAKLGFKYQFITLAGFHALHHSMYQLAHGYAQNGMTSYVKLQQDEFEAEKIGYTATKHQKEVGTEYYDLVMTTIDKNSSSVSFSDSTEHQQF